MRNLHIYRYEGQVEKLTPEASAVPYMMTDYQFST